MSVLVGGYVPLTTVDYPGELAAVVFLQGCGWRCHYCHNQELIPSTAQEGAPTWPELLARLEDRRGLLDAVVFSGGEPTLQHGLRPAVEAVKAMGFKVGLHTNGAYPVRLERVLSALDWVGLDIKAQPEDYEAITAVRGSGRGPWESLAMLAWHGAHHQARVTVQPDWSQDYISSLTDAIRRVSPSAEIRLQPCNL
ncbi:MAG: anaerobic ribonucleoside-triphosphate reductase activating protein [Marichromatium sp.]|nr:anaerobic ribonucleoside-triphosphate reductase activating protein [Marichromatium sp.]